MMWTPFISGEVIHLYKSKHGKWPDTLDQRQAEHSGLFLKYGYQYDDNMVLLFYQTAGMMCDGGSFYRSDKKEWKRFSKPISGNPDYRELKDLENKLRKK